MNRAIKLFAGAAVGLVGILAPAAIDPIRAQNSAQNLQIYWIDVEGGAATLIVSPSGESLLLDTGFPDADRDAKRIYAAAQKAGLKQIDYLVISHWHRDHEGGLAALAKMIPIGRFFDHGDVVEAVDNARLDNYNGPSRLFRRRRCPGFSRRHQPAGPRSEQRSPQGSGPIGRPRKAAGDCRQAGRCLRKKFVPENGEAAGTRRHLAGPSVVAGQRSEP